MESIEKLLTSITNKKLAYSLPEVANTTTLSVSLLRKHIRTGALKATKIGRGTVILADDLATYLLGQKSA
jgi:predicted site-specific integrase-resolvase